ncbi:MAG TPA: hypothetical protein VIX37_21955 [Candidatus Sulfotelmatobacter sp.]
MLTPALQFAVSLVFVYLLLSALSSAIQEIVANLAKWRANTLEVGIEQLLQDTNLKNEIYKHPLLRGVWRPNWLFKAASKVHKPAYISSSMFAQVLQDLRTTPGSIPASTQRILDAVLKGAANADEEKKKIEHWFDDAMDGVSGWYKRKANAWLWVISALVCIALNADTISVGKILWNDPTARAAVSEAAKNYATHKAGNDAGAGAPTLPEVKDELSRVTNARDDLEKLPVPLGWCEEDCLPDDPRRPPTAFYPLLLKCIGILISVLAVSQGAPFWFDLLQKAVNLRLAGDLPPDSRAQN